MHTTATPAVDVVRREAFEWAARTFALNTADARNLVDSSADVCIGCGDGMGVGELLAAVKDAQESR